MGSINWGDQTITLDDGSEMEFAELSAEVFGLLGSNAPIMRDRDWAVHMAARAIREEKLTPEATGKSDRLSQAAVLALIAKAEHPDTEHVEFHEIQVQIADLLIADATKRGRLQDVAELTKKRDAMLKQGCLRVEELKKRAETASDDELPGIMRELIEVALEQEAIPPMAAEILRAHVDEAEKEHAAGKKPEEGQTGPILLPEGTGKSTVH